MEEQRRLEERTLSQSLVREIAPVLALGVGITGGVLWSLATGWALTSAPPYLLVQSLLLLLAFYLATRGAPRWSYPWLAFGIVAVQALLRALIPASDADITSSAVGAVALGGPILAVLIASTIAVRSWGDASFFIGLYLTGFITGLPVVLLQPEDGAVLGIEFARIVLLVVQMGLASAAILVWNRRATIVALGLIAALLIISALAASVLAPLSDTNAPADLSAFGFLRLIALMTLLTFGIGSLRRVFAGYGFLTASDFFTTSEGEEEGTQDEELQDERPEQPPAPPDDDTQRPRRRRRRRRPS